MEKLKVLGFTLIEMVIVLIILGSFLLMTMGFSWNQLSQLRAQYEINEINDLMYYSHAISQRSKYIDNKEYKNLFIRFTDSSVVITTDFDTIVRRLDLQYNTLVLGAPVVELKVTPYILGCQVTQGDVSSLQVMQKSGGEKCFTIDTVSCKMIGKECK